MAEKKLTKVTTKKAAVKKEPVVKAEPTSKFTLPVFNLSGKEVGSVKLPEEVFGVKVNEALLSQAVRVYTANTHQGTVSTKTRAEVRGGGRKPWRQKGTGRARQGSTRSPQWRGGGVVFGPRPRDLSLELPTKMKRAALKSALSARLNDVVVVDDFKMTEPKTKKIANALKKLNLSGKTLFVLPEFEEKVIRASRNIPTLRLTRATDLNALEVLTATKLVLAKEAVSKIAEVNR